jgi:phenylacetate-CoA ligase
MPLIRYDIGDTAEIGSAVPSCGRGLPTLRRILGRDRNIFRFRDGRRVWPVLASFRVQDFVPLRQLQIVQIDFDRIEVRYVPDGSDRPIDLPGLTQSIRTVLGQRIDVAVHPVERIARSRSGKYEDCISLVAAN